MNARVPQIVLLGFIPPFNPRINVVPGDMHDTKMGVFSHRGNPLKEPNIDSGAEGGNEAQQDHSWHAGVYFAPTGYVN